MVQYILEELVNICTKLHIREIGIATLILSKLLQVHNLKQINEAVFEKSKHEKFTAPLTEPVITINVYSRKQGINMQYVHHKSTTVILFHSVIHVRV